MTPKKRARYSITQDGSGSGGRGGSGGGGGGTTTAVINNQQQQQRPEQMDVDEGDLNLSEDEEGGTRIGDIYIPPPVKPYCSNKSVGPRLIITKILNRNFKSYAGEVWLGPFFHCFHAIIGPNGSGKSNVIDSMLFVFGYRANKIRCKKLSVLIHSSAQNQSITNCQVTVHFAEILDKPNNTFEIIAGSEFCISRTAFKDNSSFYTIDDRRVMFKDVTRRLKEHNIDLDNNRFLILQGEVESISTMKPKGQADGETGHLEYLEDIIGTDRYKEPLIKINNRVDKLTEERTEKHNRCKMAQREMDDLKEPMEDAVEYLKLENDLTRTRNLQIQKYLNEQNIRLEELETEQTSLNGRIGEHDGKYDKMKSERLAKEEIIKEEIAEHERLTKKQDEYEQLLKNVFNKYNEIQASIDAVNKRRKQTKSQLKKEEEQLEELKKVPDKNTTEISECEDRMKKLIPQKEEFERKLEKNLEELQSQTAPLIEKKEQLSTQLIDVQTDVDKCKSDLALAQSELEICQSTETTERRKFATIQNSLEDTKVALAEKQETLNGLNVAVPELKEQLTVKKRELEQNLQQEKDMTRKWTQYRREMEEKTNSMQAAKSNNKVLNALMKQKYDGNIPGILGRLGDLGGIDSKYDVAISTGCGRLENIVVDTVDTAQACLEYLKRYDVGRATFIALEKIQHLTAQANKKISTPENVPRLFDLVRVEDQRVLPAFYFALRDTLVPDDLNQGTRIAYGARRFRVVTLQGEVIEMSGTMSGGGRTQLRGRMGQTVTTKTVRSDLNISAADLEQMQIRAHEMREQINYIQEQQGALEREIQQLTHQLAQRESELKRILIDCKSLKQQLPELTEQCEKQRQKMETTRADPKKVEHLKSIIDVKTKLFDESKAAAKKFTDKIAKIQEKINEITGEKVQMVEKKIADLTKQIAKLSANTTKLNVEIITSIRNVEKAQTKITNMQNEIKAAEDAIIKGTEEREQADRDAVELKERINTLKEEIQQTQTGSTEVKKEIVALQKAEAAGKMIRLELEQTQQSLNKKITEVSDNIPHWRNKLKPLKLNRIPNEMDQEPESLKTYTDDELATHKLQDLQYKISVQEEKLKSQTPNLNVIDEYFRKREVYLERVQVLEDITNKRNEMRQLYDDVRKKRYTEFMQGFTIITRKLKEMYQMITLGGDAELELVDSMDPFSEGVSFSVRPPKKSWKNISNLSGGEKTLSSLALVFALHYYKPSPLYFMDEIDAALDFRNVSIVANYIKARTKNAQFIIISLRSNMFELADYLSGIYKVKDCTHSVTIENVVPDECVIQTSVAQAIDEPSQQQQQQQQPNEGDTFIGNTQQQQPQQQQTSLTINNNNNSSIPDASRLSQPIANSTKFQISINNRNEQNSNQSTGGNLGSGGGGDVNTSNPITINDIENEPITPPLPQSAVQANDASIASIELRRITAAAASKRKQSQNGESGIDSDDYSEETLSKMFP